MTINFSTPKGTTGLVSFLHPAAGGTFTLTNEAGKYQDIVVTLAAGGSGDVEINDLPGGNYTAVLKVN